jgi:hypothetical protein
MNSKLIDSLGQLEDWEYIGGMNSRGIKRWRIIMQTDIDPLPFSDNCQCGRKLIYKHYIRNIYDHSNIKVMGANCVKEFIRKDICCAECENKVDNDDSNLCKGCGGDTYILCSNCGLRYNTETEHDCINTKCCPSCDTKYDKNRKHLCPHTIISCLDCFLNVQRGGHNDECRGCFLGEEIREGKYKGGRNGDVLFLGDLDFIKEVARCRHQTVYIDLVLESKLFADGWVIRPKNSCPDCLFDCWSGHDCCGKLLWCSNSDGELWGDLLFRDPKQFELMAVKYPFLLPYVGTSPNWECKQDCPICFLNVRISEHECNDFLFQPNRSDELWGDVLKVNPQYEVGYQHIDFVTEVLEYGLFEKVWQLSPKEPCNECFLEVREGHRCRGKMLLREDKLYKNGVWGDILKVDFEYIKSISRSRYINRVLESSYFNDWVMTPESYCDDCFMIKGVHKCMGSILYERVDYMRVGDMIKNKETINKDFINDNFINESFINDISKSKFFLENWKLEPLINCSHCFLETTKVHNCVDTLFRIKEGGKYDGYLWGDVIKLSPNRILNTAKGDELTYITRVLKSKLFDKWIVYPLKMCPKCFLNISPIHECRRELKWTFNKGKHVGKKWGDVLLSDPEYIMWTISTFHSDNWSLIGYIGKMLESKEFAKKWNSSESVF